MNLRDSLALYERLYMLELVNRDNLVNRLQLSFAALSGVGAGLAYLLANFTLAKASPAVHALFTLSMVAGIVLWIFSGYFFVRAFFGSTYECIATPEKIETYRQTLIEHYAPYEGGARLAEEEQEKYLLRDLTSAASANAEVNTYRWEILHQSNGFLVAAVVCAIVAGLVFVFGDLATPPRTP